MNLNDLQIMNRTTGKNQIFINLKKHQLFMIGVGMTEKDARTMLKLLHIGRTNKRKRIVVKQYIRICKIMYKYGYVLINSL